MPNTATKELIRQLVERQLVEAHKNHLNNEKPQNALLASVFDIYKNHPGIVYTIITSIIAFGLLIERFTLNGKLVKDPEQYQQSIFYCIIAVTIIIFLFVFTLIIKHILIKKEAHRIDVLSLLIATHFGNQTDKQVEKLAQLTSKKVSALTSLTELIKKDKAVYQSGSNFPLLLRASVASNLEITAKKVHCATSSLFWLDSTDAQLEYDPLDRIVSDTISAGNTTFQYLICTPTDKDKDFLVMRINNVMERLIKKSVAIAFERSDNSSEAIAQALISCKEHIQFKVLIDSYTEKTKVKTIKFLPSNDAVIRQSIKDKEGDEKAVRESFLDMWHSWFHTNKQLFVSQFGLGKPHLPLANDLLVLKGFNLNEISDDDLFIKDDSGNIISTIDEVLITGIESPEDIDGGDFFDVMFSMQRQVQAFMKWFDKRWYYDEA